MIFLAHLNLSYTEKRNENTSKYFHRIGDGECIPGIESIKNQSKINLWAMKPVSFYGFGTFVNVW